MFIKAYLKEPKKKKTQKISNNNLTYHLKKLEKRQTKPKVIRRKETIKIREDINKIETPARFERLLKQRAVF